MKRFALLLGMAALLAGCSGSDAPSEESSASEVAEVSEETSWIESIEAAPVGETVSYGTVNMTIDSVEELEQADSGFNTAAKLGEGQCYVLIKMTVHNLASQTMDISAMNFDLKDKEGTIQEAKVPTVSNYLQGTVGSNAKLTGVLLFTAPQEEQLILSYSPLFQDAVCFQVRE